MERKFSSNCVVLTDTCENIYFPNNKISPKPEKKIKIYFKIQIQKNKI